MPGMTVEHYKTVKEFLTNLDNTSKSEESLEKIEKMENLLGETDYDKFLREGRKIAVTPGGFEDSETRRKAYFKALKLDKNDYLLFEEQIRAVKASKTSLTTLHKEDRTIEVDVERSVLNSLFEDKDLKQALKWDIKEILRVFIRMNNQRYSYFQGFHDIALYFYLINRMDRRDTLLSLQRVAEFYFIDYMDDQKGAGVQGIMPYFTSLLNKRLEEDSIQAKFNESDTYFAISWIITWFSHNINDPLKLLRILDYLIFSPPRTVYLLSVEVNSLIS